MHVKHLFRAFVPDLEEETLLETQEEINDYLLNYSSSEFDYFSVIGTFDADGNQLAEYEEGKYPADQFKMILDAIKEESYYRKHVEELLEKGIDSPDIDWYGVKQYACWKRSTDQKPFDIRSSEVNRFVFCEPGITDHNSEEYGKEMVFVMVDFHY